MIKVLSCRLQQCLGLFTMLHVKGYSEMGFLDINVTTFFRVRNFGNSSAMESHLKNAKEDSETLNCP